MEEKKEERQRPKVRRGAGGKFAPGNKSGGRTKGTPNKASLVIHEKLAAYAKAHGLLPEDVDPVTQLMKIAERTQDDNLKATIHKSLLPYVHPARKAVEMDVHPSELPPVQLIIRPDSLEKGKDGA